MAVRSGSFETRNVDHVALAILRSQAGQSGLVVVDDGMAML